ncbi:MAG: hypothetical protein K8I29_14620 [Alphaproteobacteria bacterium]|uniref:NrfJ n=1 Tax=Candidatus Nitrobium versatile TaxID=2884831 RepID=A0A953M0Y3_9BACT|nr:hypothetical protein [Candidatus Nitrobium versatile]
MRKFFVAGMIALSLCAVSLPDTHAGAQNGVSGKVVETMDSGGYTYVRLEKNGKKIWAAIPQTKVSKGQTISLKPGTEMVNFESKTLKRSFDTIIFSEGMIK